MSSKPPVSRAEHQEHREDDTGDVGTAEVKGSGSLPQPGSARSSRHQAYGTARQNLDGIILLSEQKLERENRNMSEQKLLREFSLISGMHRARNLLWLRLLLVKSGLQHPVGLYSVLGTEWVLLSEVRTATPWEQLYGSCLHLPRGDHEAQ